MKGLFRRPPSGEDEGAKVASSSGASSVSKATGSTAGNKTTKPGTGSPSSGPLGASFTIPPFPNPLPDRALSLHCTRGGLVILPNRPSSAATSASSEESQSSKQRATKRANHHSPRPSISSSSGGIIFEEVASASPSSSTTNRNAPTAENVQGARLDWSKNAKPARITAAEAKSLLGDEADGVAQSDALEIQCHGIVGIQRLFKGDFRRDRVSKDQSSMCAYESTTPLTDAYLLVITSRAFAGDFVHVGMPVYKSTAVLPIPLSYARAKEVFKVEAQRQTDAQRDAEKKRTAAAAASKSLDISSSEEDDDDEDTSGADDVVTPSIVPRDSFIQSLEKDRAATVKPIKSKGPWTGVEAAKKSRSASDDDGKTPTSQGQDQEVDAPGGVPDAQPAVVQAVLPEDEQALPKAGGTVDNRVLTADQRWHEATKAELEEKVVKETARQYSRGEMWFAYDFDLTTPLQRKEELRINSANAGNKTAQQHDKMSTSSTGTSRSRSGSTTTARSSNPVPFLEPFPTLPLWRRADRRFWHNEHLIRDFVDAGLHALVLPIMQGFFQVTPLPLDLSSSSPPVSTDLAGDAMDAVSEAASSERVEAQLLIVSRRSKERAGLRYQRRGTNDEGQVANYVETEQILYVKRGSGQIHLMTFVQFRGSIPLYWSQNPFNLKPPPVLERSAAENKQACKKHFDVQVQRYGKVICINLAEQKGKEGQITQAYKDAVEQLGRPDQVEYRAFDFHKECAGMKFENVRKLIDEVKDDVMADMDCFWSSTSTSGDPGQQVVHQRSTFSRQSGAFRVSCLDCLDRTNVVQSAFARYMLLVQLQRLGFDIPSAKGEKDEAFDFAFNDSWANNGDMVSQIYAGTRALKGDFTRTGKRNLMGMMNDATASVYRMVQGAVSDFFKQTVADFQYGQISLSALERYNDDLAAQDPSEGHRLRRVRASAIETCASMVLEADKSDESLLAGWTLFSTIEPNSIASSKLEEKVVLLTTKAIYCCGYDFTAEKLVEFSRILLGDIVGIQKGLYLLAPNEGYHPEDHWGFVVSFLNEETRVNTASIKNVPKVAEPNGPTNFLAFRAVSDEFAGTLVKVRRSEIKKGDKPKAPSFSTSRASSRSRGLFGLGSRPSSNSAVDSAPTAMKRREARQAASVPSSDEDDDDDESTPKTAHAIVNRIVDLILDECVLAGSADADGEDGFVTEKTIQSLAQARQNASLFAPLIEGIKRRVWL